MRASEAHIIPAGDVSTLEDFNAVWMAEFTKTNAYEVWDRSTDPMVFDIVEPRLVCNPQPHPSLIPFLSLGTLVTRNRQWCQI